MKISPAILYPGIVVGLLMMSVGSSFWLLRTAKSDNGAQILDNYYENALEWDRLQAERDRVRSLGWSLDVQLLDGDSGRIAVRDASSNPVEGLEATVLLRRPQLADAVSSSTLQAVAGEPGVYAFDHVPVESGLWDVVLEGQWNEQSLRFEQRYMVGE